MALLETDTLSNQNISTALEIGSYTADAARHIYARVFADQVAGNDDYVIYMTVQLAGAGSAYKSQVTTEAVAASVTSIAFQSIAFPVSNTDVAKVYLTGAAGDTTTVDTRVEWWEDPAARLDVAATGEAGLDFDNIKAATGATTLTNITVPTVTTTTSVTNGVTVTTNNDKTGYGLADDAITSAKFDESTAYPLKSADSGSTYIARTGADSDTLETLSDQLDGVGSASDPLENDVPGSYTSGTAGYALGRIGSGIIQTTSIVAADNAVTTYEGDDYNNTDGRALDWTESESSIWPSDLTGATITVTIADYATSFTGSVVTATGSSQKVRLELTRAQTTLIPPGTKSYMVRATLSASYSSRQATLVRGTWKHYNKVGS